MSRSLRTQARGGFSFEDNYVYLRLLPLQLLQENKFTAGTLSESASVGEEAGAISGGPMGLARLPSLRCAHFELARTISPSARMVGASVCMNAATWMAEVVFPLPPLKFAMQIIISTLPHDASP